MYHLPVLLKDCINGLQIKEEGVYVDVTFGGGGHSREILKQLGPNGKLFAFDQDDDAKINIPNDKRFTFIEQNFRFIKNALRIYGINEVDGILADFGVSSHQFDVAERGFSTRFDSKLDMRMNRKNQLSAFEVINSYEEEALSIIFKNFGELHQHRKFAREIVIQRQVKPIETTIELKSCLKKFIKKENESKTYSQLFQALRIEVNEEIEVIKEFLSQTKILLKPGGRLVVLSYHSLEDRLVKNFMKTGNCEGTVEKDFFGNIKNPFRLLTKKPVVPSTEELSENSRARSAKLRIAEKQNDGQ